MNPDQFLLALVQFFGDHPNRWTFGALARNEVNEAVSPDADDAFSFSPRGFTERARLEGLIDNACQEAVCDRLYSVCRQHASRHIDEAAEFLGMDAFLALVRSAVK